VYKNGEKRKENIFFLSTRLKVKVIDDFVLWPSSSFFLFVYFFNYIIIIITIIIIIIIIYRIIILLVLIGVRLCVVVGCIGRSKNRRKKRKNKI
jgi:hypothetical protein